MRPMARSSTHPQGKAKLTWAEASRLIGEGPGAFQTYEVTFLWLKAVDLTSQAPGHSSFEQENTGGLRGVPITNCCSAKLYPLKLIFLIKLF